MNGPVGFLLPVRPSGTPSFRFRGRGLPPVLLAHPTAMTQVVTGANRRRPEPIRPMSVLWLTPYAMLWLVLMAPCSCARLVAPTCA